MATAPTLYWYQLDSGTLAPTYFGQLDAAVAELCTENSVTAPTAKWWNPIACQLVSTWQVQIDTAVRALCTALLVAEPIPLILGSNAGQYQSEYAESLDGVVRALCSVYHADAVHFDGANSAVTINSLSCTDGGLLSFAYFIKTAMTQNGKSVWVSDPAGTYASYGYFLTPGNIQTQVTSAVGGLAVAMSFDDPLSNGVWHSVVGCFDINHVSPDKAFKVYVDRVDVTNIDTESAEAVVMALNTLAFVLGDDGAGGGFTGDLANFWFAPNQSILTDGEISVAMLNKFVTPDNKPMDLGADGSTPTGIAPAIYFSGDATAFVTNRGTGGAFTLTGSLTNASTSPSD